MEVAGAVVLLASPAAALITGETTLIDGWLDRGMKFAASGSPTEVHADTRVLMFLGEAVSTVFGEPRRRYA
jgi:hypothetical protein